MQLIVETDRAYKSCKKALELAEKVQRKKIRRDSIVIFKNKVKCYRAIPCIYPKPNRHNISIGYNVIFYMSDTNDLKELLNILENVNTPKVRLTGEEVGLIFKYGVSI